jgi:hypothetical protein
MKKNTNTIKAVAGQKLSEEQIKAFVEHFNTKGSIPGNKIICNETFKLTTCVGPWRAKKIAEYGSLENLLRNYKCRGVNKKIRQEKIKAIGSTVKRGRKTKQKEEINYDIPKMTFKQRDPLAGEQLTEMTKKICQRPDVFLNNGRHCLDCPTFELCANANKCLTKGFAFKDGEFVEV